MDAVSKGSRTVSMANPSAITPCPLRTSFTDRTGLEEPSVASVFICSLPTCPLVGPTDPAPEPWDPGATIGAHPVALAEHGAAQPWPLLAILRASQMPRAEAKKKEAFPRLMQRIARLSQPMPKPETVPAPAREPKAEAEAEAEAVDTEPKSEQVVAVPDRVAPAPPDVVAYIVVRAFRNRKHLNDIDPAAKMQLKKPSDDDVLEVLREWSPEGVDVRAVHTARVHSLRPPNVVVVECVDPGTEPDPLTVLASVEQALRDPRQSPGHVSGWTLSTKGRVPLRKPDLELE